MEPIKDVLNAKIPIKIKIMFTTKTQEETFFI